MNDNCTKHRDTFKSCNPTCVICPVCGKVAKEVRNFKFNDGATGISYLHRGSWVMGDYHFKWTNLWPEGKA